MEHEPQPHQPQHQPQPGDNTAPPQHRSWQHVPSYNAVPPLFGENSHAQSAQPQQNQQERESAHARLAAKHQESKHKYPELHLSQDEYVILEVRRHPIGLLSIWSVVVIVAIATFALLPLYSLNREGLAASLMLNINFFPSPALVALPLLLLTILSILGGLLAAYIYNGNRFYLTNESVVQHIRSGLLNKKEQMINLASIEDASYRQKGILQTFLKYGTLRLSTEGEETTYRFYFVANPAHIVRQITEAIEDATGNAARFRKHAAEAVNLEKF